MTTSLSRRGRQKSARGVTLLTSAAGYAGPCSMRARDGTRERALLAVLGGLSLSRLTLRRVRRSLTASGQHRDRAAVPTGVASLPLLARLSGWRGPSAHSCSAFR